MRKHFSPELSSSFFTHGPLELYVHNSVFVKFPWDLSKGLRWLVEHCFMIRECNTKHNPAVSAVSKTSASQNHLWQIFSVLTILSKPMPKTNPWCHLMPKSSLWAQNTISNLWSPTDEPKLTHLRYLSSSVIIKITMLQPWSRFSHLETEQIQEKSVQCLWCLGRRCNVDDNRIVCYYLKMYHFQL